MHWLWLGGWGALLLCPSCGKVTRNDAAMATTAAGGFGTERDATATEGDPPRDAGSDGEAMGTTDTGVGGAEADATEAGGNPPGDAGPDGKTPPECADFVGRATPEQTARTWRERPIAELLALDHAEPTDPIAPPDEYERIVADLDAMQAAHPDLPVLFLDQVPLVIPLPTWGTWTRAVIEFTELGHERVTAGSYFEWDCVNALYEVNDINLDFPQRRVRLNFDGLYNLPLILQDYAALPEVVSAEPAYEVDVGSDACVSRDGAVATYIFWNGYGDCPAGCTAREYWGFRVTQGDFEDSDAGAGEREVEYLGYVPDEMDDPEWFSAAGACTQFIW